MLEKKLLEEVKRFNSINKYGKKMIMEQDAPPVAPTDEPAGDVPPPPPAGGEDPLGNVPPPPPAGGDAAAPTDVPPAGDAGAPPMDDTMGGDTEEIDITDLVNMTKNIKNDLESNKQDNSAVINKMDDVFTKLSDLESKLAQMDQVMAKIDQLGAKVQEMKPKTEVERLEMRSLDSYPFNEKPQDFFSHKQGEMKASGKNEYILTKDDVENYAPDEVRSSFNPNEEEKDEYSF
jgi:outer membrane murein-binding lipoprotein Lpp